MPCYQQVERQVKFANKNFTMLKAVADRLKWPIRQMGEVVYVDAPAGSIRIANGTATCADTAQMMSEVDKLRVAVSHEIIRQSAARHGFRVQRNPLNPKKVLLVR